jgi:hypothetical protein
MIDNPRLPIRLASLRIMRQQKQTSKPLSATAMADIIHEEFLLAEKKQCQQILREFEQWKKQEMRGTVGQYLQWELDKINADCRLHEIEKELEEVRGRN